MRKRKQSGLFCDEGYATRDRSGWSVTRFAGEAGLVIELSESHLPMTDALALAATIHDAAREANTWFEDMPESAYEAPDHGLSV